MGQLGLCEAVVDIVERRCEWPEVSESGGDELRLELISHRA